MIGRRLRRLFRRSKHTSYPGTPSLSPAVRAYAIIARARERIAREMENAPEMCEVRLGLPTARVTRVIDQGPTLCEWNDEGRTWEMETVKIEKP